MPKLWELSTNLVELENLIDDILDSDLPEEQQQARLNYVFEQWLVSDAEFEKKAEAVAAYIVRLQALAEARKAEYKRLRNLAEQTERQADNLKAYLSQYLQKHNKPKIEGISVKLSLRRKPAKVCLNCEPEQLPQEFQRVKIEPKLNEIKSYLRLNPECDFAFLSNLEEYSLIIK